MTFTRIPSTIALIACFLSSLLLSEMSLQERANARSLAEEYLTFAEHMVEANQPEKARSFFEKSIELYSKDPMAHFKFGNFLFNQGSIDMAASHYKKAIELNAQVPQFHYNLGVCCTRLKNYDTAVNHLRRAQELKPDYHKATLELSNALEQKGAYQEAADLLENLVLTEKQSVDAYHRLGRVYVNLEALDKAEHAFRNALALSPHDATLLLELANTLTILERPSESIGFYMRVLEMYPNTKAALYNFGYCLKQLGKTEEAASVYQKTLDLYPDYSLGHFALSTALLSLGNLEKGWQEYEWRWQAYNESPKQFPQPEWKGQDLTGKTLFIYAEQGLGDTLQFVRYAKMLKKPGVKIVFETQAALQTILSQCPYLDKVISRGTPLPDFDYHVALMSIPYIVKTRLETIPQDIPYLHTDPALIAYWREKLSADKNLKIGICWQGNAHYRTLALRRAVAAKSVNLSLMAELSSIPGVSLYSLQKVDGTDQLDRLDARYVIKTFGPDIDTVNGRFMDTAAIMQNLDLIITVDTAPCHLAGGLGCRNIWLILPEPADWRWLEQVSTSPWYPAMRLFRQPAHGNWRSVIETLKKEITLLTGKHTESAPLTDKITHIVTNILNK